MKRFPFKRQLIILACIITALCVAIPVTTFAKSASSEPHHPTPTIRHLTTTASGDPSFSVTTDADCHVGADTVVSFHKGDVVSGSAQLVTTQGDPTEEAGEDEPLLLQGTNVPSIPPIAVDSGSHSFSFTATGDGTLTACVGGSDGGDGDESGTITGTVTPAPPSSTEFNLGFAENWGGFVSQGTKDHPVTYTDVKASWKVPKADCSTTPNGTSGFWVGIGGVDKDKFLEQIGTNDYCIKGKPSYMGFYEMVPAGPVFFDSKKFPFKPGDSIDAEVLFQGNGKFQLTLKNSTRGWTFSTTQTQKAAELNSAEWIAEANTDKLTDFSSILFTNCTFNQGMAFGSGPLTTAYTIYGFKEQFIPILEKVFHFPIPSFSIRAIPVSAIVIPNAFVVIWAHE